MAQNSRIIGQILVLILVLAVVVSCKGSEQKTSLMVFAAASLTDVFSELKIEYEQHTNVDLEFNFGPSLMLATEISHGAPADVLISADPESVALLVDENYASGEDVVTLATNVMVVLANEVVDSVIVESIQDLGMISIADPQLAPAGKYAMQALKNLGIWDEIKDRVVIGTDVRAALAYLQMGNVDAAIVYKSDQTIVPDKRIVDMIPTESHDQIKYVGVSVSTGEFYRESNGFIEFLTTSDAQAIFAKHGFMSLKP